MMLFYSRLFMFFFFCIVLSAYALVFPRVHLAMDFHVQRSTNQKDVQERQTRFKTG
jgi:cell division protein FtsL